MKERTATFRIKVIAASAPPVPPFVGTSITIRLESPDALNWGIRKATLAEGCDTVAIDWGDGSREEVREIASLRHAYPATGEYCVRIGDAISELNVATASDDEFIGYATRVIALRSNARRLTSFGTYAFKGAVNLRTVDLTGAALAEIKSLAFSGCDALGERLDLPVVSKVGTYAFRPCTSLKEIHFSEANEAAITALQSFKVKPSFGAVNAVISFDL